MFQQITIVGRLGKDPSMRTTPGGKSVTSFSVATDDGYGEKKATTWHTVSAWDKLAEVTHQYLTKGKLVLVVGRVRAGAYEKDSQPVGTLEVTAHTVKFLEGAKQGETVTTVTDTSGMTEEDVPW